MARQNPMIPAWRRLENEARAIAKADPERTHPGLHEALDHIDRIRDAAADLMARARADVPTQTEPQTTKGER